MNKKTIEDAFTHEGYISIPFTFNGVGQPLIMVTINNLPCHLLLDTGAAINLLDYEMAEKLGLTQTPTGEKGSGAGGVAYEIFNLGQLVIEINGHRFMFETFYSMDFTSIKDALTSREVTEEIHGILGFSFFTMTKCFIDYSANRLFLLNG